MDSFFVLNFPIVLFLVEKVENSWENVCEMGEIVCNHVNDYFHLACLCPVSVSYTMQSFILLNLFLCFCDSFFHKLKHVPCVRVHINPQLHLYIYNCSY